LYAPYSASRQSKGHIGADTNIQGEVMPSNPDHSPVSAMLREVFRLE
jgi:hypothetical protein